MGMWIRCLWRAVYSLCLLWMLIKVLNVCPRQRFPNTWSCNKSLRRHPKILLRASNFSVFIFQKLCQKLVRDYKFHFNCICKVKRQKIEQSHGTQTTRAVVSFSNERLLDLTANPFSSLITVGYLRLCWTRVHNLNAWASILVLKRSLSEQIFDENTWFSFLVGIKFWRYFHVDGVKVAREVIV